MKVIIFGNHTQGLGILRSLKAVDAELHMINDRVISLSRYSKYLTSYHFVGRYCLKNIYEDEYSDRLLTFIKKFVPEGANLPVFYVNEDIIHFLYRQRADTKDRLKIPFDGIMDIIDKFNFAREIEKLGLDTPETCLLSSFDPASLYNGNCVCKGRIGNRFKNLSKKKGRLIKSAYDLELVRRSISGIMSEDEVLIQKKITSNKQVFSSCGLSINGNLYRHFQYVKLRQHPDEFGTGTFLKSIRDSNILALTQKIIDHFGYTGIFEIEFLFENGKYIVLEMNPRTWKSIHFATLCGQNLCKSYIKYIVEGLKPTPKLDFCVGKTWADLGTDLPVLLKNRQWRHAGYDKNTYYCVLNRKDPLPFLMELFLSPFIALDI